MPNPGTGFGTVTATGTLMAGLKVQRIALTPTGSGAVKGAAWINPEPGTVMAEAMLIITGVGSAETFDMGRTADGTGTVANIIDGGTYSVGVHIYGTLGTIGTIGNVDGAWRLYGPGGTGTNNSVTVTPDNPTGTAAGYLVVSYFRVD